MYYYLVVEYGNMRENNFLSENNGPQKADRFFFFFLLETGQIVIVDNLHFSFSWYWLQVSRNAKNAKTNRKLRWNYTGCI